MTFLRWIAAMLRPVYGTGIDERPVDVERFGFDSSQPLGVQRPSRHVNGIPVTNQNLLAHLAGARRNLEEANERLRRARMLFVIAWIGLAFQVFVFLLGLAK